jgi:hypothetical protein
MVISPGIIVRDMGYRGFKSPTPFFKIGVGVKEQRVDGSSLLNYKGLRCSLMGFERNYQIRILSKVLHKKEIRFYSTSNLKNQIHISP